MLDAPTYVRHVQEVGGALADAAEGHLDVRVPTCPDYTVEVLVRHAATFCQWVAAILRGGGEPVAPDEVGGGDAVLRHRKEHEQLVHALQDTAFDAECWSWGSDQHARFWFRRAAQELAVHSWDVQNAVGGSRPIDAALAADGIEEYMREFSAIHPIFGPGAAAKLGLDGESIHFHPTDTDGELLVVARGDYFEVSNEHAKATVAARGPAQHLLLFVWGRLPVSAIDVVGDASILKRWAEKVHI